jgi:LmbE family N-acetylglucosaminyl deacetylase
MRSLSKLFLKSFSRAARPYLKSYGLLQTAKVFNRSALVWEPHAETVLVLAPHMDDETIGCGGALAKHVARGASVTVAFLTDGGAGGSAGAGDASGASLTGTSLTDTRKKEARAALAVLGVRHLEFLDAPDGQLQSSPPLAEKLRTILLGTHFDLVYLPFFLEEHPDHRAASQLLLDAARGTDLHPQCLGYEVWTALFPNCLVNIDETAALKREALSHYRSQLAEADYAHTQFGLNAYRSAAFLGGTCRYAEAFCSLSLEQYRQLYAAYLRE